MSASAPLAPTSPQRTLFDRLDDAVNPIVVKELRQAVQSRFVVAVLLIFLMLQLLWIGVRLLFFGARGEFESIDFQAGQEVFTTQQGILLFTCMVFLPLYTGIRLAAERNDANTDLLYVTTIQPRSIVLGKIFSACVLAVLILSACMPFMALTYYLRGIDWPSIVVIVGIDLLVVLASVQAMVFLAVIPCSRVFKAMLALAGLVTLCFIFARTLEGTTDLLRSGQSSRLRDVSFWVWTVSFVYMMLALCGLLAVWSIALLSVPSANRALPVRIYSLLLWGSSLVLAMVATFLSGFSDPLRVWIMAMTIFACLNLAIAIGERRHFSPRLLRTVPRWPLPRRLAFVFYSGAAGGVLFAMLLMLLTVFAAILVAEWAWEPFVLYFGIPQRGLVNLDEQLFSHLAACILGFLYALAYALTAVFVRSYLFRRLPTTTTPLVAIILLGIGSAVPWIIGSLIYMHTWRPDDQHYWLLANPFVAWNEIIMRSHGFDLHRGFNYFVFAALWALFAIAINLPWLFAQFGRFRRPAKSQPSVVVEPAHG